MKNLLLSMSFSGSVIVFLYVIFYPAARRYLPDWWRYAVLILAMFFYLFPVPLFQYKIRELLYRIPFLDNGEMVVEKIIRRQDPSFVILLEGGQAEIAPRVLYTGIIIGISVFLSVAVTAYILLRHIRLKKAAIVISEKETPRKWQEVLTAVKWQLGMKNRKIRLLCSGYCKAPVTMGIFSPVIIFPEPSEEVDGEAFELMLKHELIHIRHRDLAWKLLGLLTVAVHWFNPVAYVLFYELCNMSEILCDASVIKGMSDSRRQAYSHLILSYAEKENEDKNKPLLANLSGNAAAAVLKRRILEMKCAGKRRPAVSVLLIFIFGMTGTMTAFAYHPPMVLGDGMGLGDVRLTEGVSVSEIEIYIGDDSGRLSSNGETESMPYDLFYVDEAGSPCPLHLDGRITPRCTHVFVDVKEINRHEKNNDGSCDMSKRQGKVCESCGYVKDLGEEDLIMYCNICPHD